MSVRTVQEFLDASIEQDRGNGTFELESAHLLEVRLDGLVWAKAGWVYAV